MRTLRSMFPLALSAGALLCLWVQPAHAQIRHPGTPASDTWRLPAAVPTVTMPPVDVERYKAEDEARNHWPLRYGAVIPTSLGLDNAGRWDDIPQAGLRVWRLRIESPGAFTIGVVFDLYRLPVGAQVFLYNDDKSHVLGAYTHENNKANYALAVEPVAGSAVTIELVTPTNASPPPLLDVGQVVHDYRNVHALIDQMVGGAQPQAKVDCTIDINCPEGANYQDVKRSVVRTLAGGVLCSGAILNNTAQDQTPYMLTANHCGSMTNGVFLFNYERSGCGTGSAPQTDTVSGATKLASVNSGNPCFSSAVDSQLYRLSTNIPSSYNPYFAGWNRSNNAGGAPAATIGHGGGGPKNIAIDSTGASSCTNWWQATWTSGNIIGGNSGGPLFDGNKRVLGPACCVNNFNCTGQTAWFGKLSVFWNNANLGQWLDPLNTGVTVLDGFDPSGSNCPQPQQYGWGEIGSTGQLGTIGWSGGDPSASNPNFAITGSGYLPNSFAFLLAGASQKQIAKPWGILWVGGPNFTRTKTTTDGSGNCSVTLVITPSMVGTTLNFEWVVRDPGFGGNLQHSPGLSVTFCP